MHKIASTDELRHELQRLLAYAQSRRPSRDRVAKALDVLSRRVAGELTDSDVLKAVDKAKRAKKSAESKANKRYIEERNNVLRLLGDAPDDVSQAARSTGLRRVEVAYGDAMDQIDAKYASALNAIRGTAGTWADLVPDFTYRPRR